MFRRACQKTVKTFGFSQLSIQTRQFQSYSSLSRSSQLLLNTSQTTNCQASDKDQNYRNVLPFALSGCDEKTFAMYTKITRGFDCVRNPVLPGSFVGGLKESTVGRAPSYLLPEGIREMGTKAHHRKKTRNILAKQKKAAKYKLRPLSSWKDRFFKLKGGLMKRWQAGTRHNAHRKSRKQRKRLKGSVLVHPTWVKKMRKMGFHGT